MDGTVKRKGGLGFWVCNFAFTLERFSFYSVKWLIVQFLVASVADGGLGVAKERRFLSVVFCGLHVFSTFVRLLHLGSFSGSKISGADWYGINQLGIFLRI